MSTVPRKNPEAIAWVKARVPVWTAAAANIGVDPAQIGELGALQSTAEDLADEAESMLAAAYAKAEQARNAADAMRSFASGQVVRIRGFARTAADPEAVYVAAQIPAPADRAPSPAPGTPVLFVIGLEQSGALNVSFKCPNPPRVGALTYRVERSLGAQQPFVFLKNAKERLFTDDTVPSGSGDVTYRVTAQSPTKDGAPGYFTVRFGVNNQAQPQAELVAQGASDSKAS
ncbi:MAG: hypothetical protein RIB58_13290 [Phycisphaerales bacterium]